MHASFLGPSDVVEHFDDVPRHLAGGVAHQRLIALAHAAVVQNQAGVFVGLCVAEVFGLALPVRHEGAQAHDPLLGLSVRVTQADTGVVERGGGGGYARRKGRMYDDVTRSMAVNLVGDVEWTSSSGCDGGFSFGGGG